jgi:hypothetical protein
MDEFTLFAGREENPSPAGSRPWLCPRHSRPACCFSHPASGHNGNIRRATHGYEATREAAMAAFAKSWRRQ